jgi:HK97 family phage major capsid protein
VPNVVLERLIAERNELIATIESVLNQVESRDLTDAEQSVLNHTRDRIQELDNQIAPLEDYERVKAQHQATMADLPHPDRANGAGVGADRLPARTRRADGPERAPVYRSAGEFVIDYLRGAGIMERGVPDMQAQARVVQARVVADQKTSDTTGILPTPIVGTVVDLIDANRPLISSLGGAKALGGIPGATFTRPKITQHTLVGVQSGEKTQLPSQKMTITPVSFTKATYGGTVDISRQDIDWTSPAAWDILVRDLANVYSVQTETAVASAFKTAATGTGVTVATNDLKGWTLALYTAAMHSYQAGFMMPDRVWCSLDVWAALGSLVDVARVVLPPDAYTGTADNTIEDSYDIGGSSLASFRGDILGLPRIVVPTFAAGTCIVGPSAMFEVYEEVIGLLSVIEPSILGVQVAYGGYLAWGALAGTALVPLTVPAGMPTMAEAEAEPPSNHRAAAK